ncbi:unnamed protein product [Prorocentrum cordatum]|uniref:C3H1-type domain-containing protein n=1 Tax=Prorocentrum cordatum TaxID=2364126 RepID=A0ABN9THU9_9DINO|nr:unnamed protein product [Polarella glacialis]
MANQPARAPPWPNCSRSSSQPWATSATYYGVCDSRPDQLDGERGTACAGLACGRGRPPAGLKLEILSNDSELMDASTPRTHGPDTWAFSSARGDSRASAADARSPTREWSAPDAAWARIRTPSPEPLAWQQSAPAKPPQWLPWQPPAVPQPPEPAAPRERGPAPPAGEAKAAAAKQERTQGGVPEMPERPGAREASSGLPPGFRGVLSVGSVGHPYACREPCKYVRKSRGCKDGAQCDRCHACVWSYYRPGPKPEVARPPTAGRAGPAGPQGQ